MTDPSFEALRIPGPIGATPEHLARLIFLSYRFSQGGIGTQNRMLLYIEENIHPDLFDPEIQPRVHAKTAEMVGAFFLNETSHPATAIPWDDEHPDDFVKTPQLVTNELAGLFERFTARDQVLLFESSPPAIAASVITMDADYLTRPGGRAGDSDSLKVRVSPYARDPYDSLFIKYAVLGDSTHTKEFDEIFASLAQMETLEALDPIAIDQLLLVVNIYCDHHPDIKDNPHLDVLKTRCEAIRYGR